MYPFLLTTDSGCDLPLEYCEQNDVTVLRMTYELDGVARKDTMRVEDFVELYEKMAQNANVHTSAINIEEYLAFWRHSLRVYVSERHGHLLLGRAIRRDLPPV